MKASLITILLIVCAISTSCNGNAVATMPEASATPVITLTVSAAADLTPPFQEIGKLFTTETGIQVAFNFGSSGQLAQQIKQGAPADVFASANRSLVDDLDKESLVYSDSIALYARGRITLWVRSDSPLSVRELGDLLKPEIARVAIANPEHAPYGVAAREALQSAGLWEAIQPKLVFGENIAQTMQYALTGNVDTAIVALSLSVAAAEQGRYTLIPEALHNPLDQALAVIRGTKHEAEARKFARFINGEAGRVVMRRYGFVLPGEAP